MYDGILNPMMKRYRCAFTLLQRIGWGMLVAVAAMLAGAYVERRRMAAQAEGGNVGVMEQAAQYLLVGASEVCVQGEIGWCTSALCVRPRSRGRARP